MQGREADTPLSRLLSRLLFSLLLVILLGCRYAPSNIWLVVPVQPIYTSYMPDKNKAAQELGRLGGKKGGKARAEKLSAERKSEIAREAAKARWAKKLQQEEEG